MERIGLMSENSIEYINILVDIWNSGDCAVLIDWRIPYQIAIEMMQEASVKKCYIEKNVWNKFFEGKQDDIEFFPFEKKSNSAELLTDCIYDKFKENYSSDEAIVLYSSGTTGKAKGIILSHYAINTNADAIIDYMKPTNADCIYIVKTLSHSSTITGELLVALKVHMKLVIAPTIVPPRFVLNNIMKFSVTIICVNPTLLTIYAEEYLRLRYVFLSLHTIYVSGSILSEKKYKFAHETFENIKIYNVYGLSEAGPRVTAQRKECCEGNSVGKPIKNVQIVIVDGFGDEVIFGDKGIIHINTPSRFNSYVTGNKLPSLYKNWLNSGDIGYIDEREELHIVDRIDDVITINSHKIYPSEIESQIIKNTSIFECAVVKLEFNGNEFIGCLYTDKNEFDIKKKDLNHVLMAHETPRFFIKCNFIPRTINGKISKKDAYKLLINSLKMEME